MCEYLETDSTLDNLEKISNIIIAFLTLILAFYVFVYQKRKDKSDRRVQWLKDLIIEPKLNEVAAFYDLISTLKSEIKSNDLDEDEKVRIIGKIKKGASDFRKSFLASLQYLAPVLHKNIQDDLDKLTDDLTNAISNDELKLCNAKTYEREIAEKIQNSHSFVLKQIFEYNG